MLVEMNIVKRDNEQHRNRVFEIFRREAVRTERMTRKDLECTNEKFLINWG